MDTMKVAGNAIKPGELPVIGYAFCLLLTVRLGLSLCSFKKVRGWALRSPAGHERRTASIDFRRAIYLFNLATHFVPATTCLVKSTAGRRFFPRLGFDCRLCIGTRRDEQNRFEAHAWLEREGKAFIGNEVSSRFVLLYSPDDQT